MEREIGKGAARGVIWRDSSGGADSSARRRESFPPAGFSAIAAQVVRRGVGAFLILDEIYTGFGRTGRWFACEHEAVADVVCLGKALAGGFPISACVGRGDVMDRAWPPSTGEAIHTSTFLGNPVGCAMALAQMREIERLRLPERSAELGRWLLGELRRGLGRFRRQVEIRGRGLKLVGGRVPRCAAMALRVVKEMLRRGYILFCPRAPEGSVLEFYAAAHHNARAIGGCGQSPGGRSWRRN